MSAGAVLTTLSARRRSPLASIGWLGWAAASVAAAMVLMALVGPYVAPHDPYAISLLDANGGPEPGHPLGFDARGRDILSRVIVGARTSLLGPLLVVGLGSLIATALAVAAAWWRGWADALVRSTFDLVLAMPALLLAILAVAVLGQGLTAAVVGLAIAYVPVMGRIVRSAALREVSLDYVTALRTMGVSPWRITTRHVAPNLVPLIMAQATTLFGYAMLDLGAISFLGLGVQEPAADWGLMVSTGASGILRGAPAESLAAGGCIVLAAAAFAVLGEILTRRIEGQP